MTLDDQQKKMLSRIANDASVKGDGQKFIALLGIMQIDALKQSVIPDDIRSRWMQGQAMGFEQLQKFFADANK